MEWFDNMEPLLQTFWLVAIPTSLIFVFQTIMTFMGADASDGIDADFDSNLEATEAPFQLFSLRNLINFLLGFSWTGISFYNSISNHVLLIFLAFLVGAFFVFVFFLIMRQLQKLAEDNSFKIKSAINKTAEVYLSIPEKMSGRGKVMISINGAYHELSAMTENERIQTGSVVRVVKIDNGNNLIVELL
jgi:membrane protein implicated in regulation of membrane protease activity